MKVDNTLLGIMEKTKQEIINKFGIELSIEEIHEVVDIQLEATKLGFIKGITIQWITFCKFVFTNRNKRGLEVSKFIRTLDEDSYDLSIEDRNKSISDFIAMKGEEKKIAVHEGLNSKDITVSDLLDKPDANKYHIPVFQLLNKRK